MSIDYIASLCAGLSQTIVGQPFDTLKVLIQNKENILKNVSLKKFYRGYKFTLTYSLSSTSIIFPLYNRTIEYTKSALISGFISGNAVAPINFILDKLIRNELKSYCFDTIHTGNSNLNEFLNMKNLRNIFQAHIDNKKNFGKEIWNSVMFIKWFNAQ